MIWKVGSTNNNRALGAKYTQYIYFGNVLQAVVKQQQLCVYANQLENIYINKSIKIKVFHPLLGTVTLPYQSERTKYVGYMKGRIVGK